MAEPALDILHPGMYPVAEGDGLFRAQTGRRVYVKKVEESRKEHKTAKGKK
jgi:hypothetical protein